ncbi:hypothetical protein G9A89_007099 [Geosiphon pyriformis]|nr:hypothetical protein G9A89_007099 [Geosiphon pyriformis]
MSYQSNYGSSVASTPISSSPFPVKTTSDSQSDDDLWQLAGVLELMADFEVETVKRDVEFAAHLQLLEAIEASKTIQGANNSKSWTKKETGKHTSTSPFPTDISWDMLEEEDISLAKTMAIQAAQMRNVSDHKLAKQRSTQEKTDYQFAQKLQRYDEEGYDIDEVLEDEDSSRIFLQDVDLSDELNIDIFPDFHDCLFFQAVHFELNDIGKGKGKDNYESNSSTTNYPQSPKTFRRSEYECQACYTAFSTFPLSGNLDGMASSSLDANFGVILSCSHGFCLTCMGNFLNSRLGEQVVEFPIRCPLNLNCTAEISERIAEKALGKNGMILWNGKFAESTMKNKVYCANKKCSIAIDWDAPLGQQNTPIDCPLCRVTFCPSCHVTWHSGLTCQQFQALPPEERSPEDRIVLQMAENEKWRRCPSCRTIVELFTGCNHITCRCKTEFCYKCGNVWDKKAESCSQKCDLWDEQMLLEERNRNRAPQNPVGPFRPLGFGHQGYAYGNQANGLVQYDDDASSNETDSEEEYERDNRYETDSEDDDEKEERFVIPPRRPVQHPAIPLPNRVAAVPPPNRVVAPLPNRVAAVPPPNRVVAPPPNRIAPVPPPNRVAPVPPFNRHLTFDLTGLYQRFRKYRSIRVSNWLQAIITNKKCGYCNQEFADIKALEQHLNTTQRHEFISSFQYTRHKYFDRKPIEWTGMSPGDAFRYSEAFREEAEYFDSLLRAEDVDNVSVVTREEKVLKKLVSRMLDSVVMPKKNDSFEVEYLNRNVVPLLDVTIRTDDQYWVKYGEQSLERVRRNRGRDPNDRARVEYESARDPKSEFTPSNWHWNSRDLWAFAEDQLVGMDTTELVWWVVGRKLRVYALAAAGGLFHLVLTHKTLLPSYRGDLGSVELAYLVLKGLKQKLGATKEVLCELNRKTRLIARWKKSNLDVSLENRERSKNLFILPNRGINE